LDFIFIIDGARCLLSLQYAAHQYFKKNSTIDRLDSPCCAYTLPHLHIKVLLAIGFYRAPMKSLPLKILIYLLSLSLMSLSWITLAGGLEDGYPDDTSVSGPAFFGFVRDERGSHITKATVILKETSGPTVKVISNILGVYRTHISVNVKIEAVTISCEKVGYKQIKLVRRPQKTNKLIETDCIMQKE
jgi:hypothetical protein